MILTVLPSLHKLKGTGKQDTDIIIFHYGVTLQHFLSFRLKLATPRSGHSQSRLRGMHLCPDPRQVVRQSGVDVWKTGLGTPGSEGRDARQDPPAVSHGAL